MTLKCAKHYLATGEPVPDGVSPEDLPHNMPAPEDGWGHGDGYIPRDFLRMTPLDKAGRRALWMRTPPVTPENATETSADGSCVELRAGREGDDDQVTLTEGEVLTRGKIRALIECLHTMSAALEGYV